MVDMDVVREPEGLAQHQHPEQAPNEAPPRSESVRVGTSASAVYGTRASRTAVTMLLLLLLLLEGLRPALVAGGHHRRRQTQL